jgi:NAD(P)-dependent dehydrogenase (short-subunit alcohol dehydrogenase family)
VQLDLADPPTLEHAVEVIRATLGPLQVLVNCAVWSPEWQPEGERFEEAPGFPANVSYGAAKAGRHGLTRFMSRELARAGILTTS